MAKTIDQLGMDASKQYADNLARLDWRLIRESQIVPQKAEVFSMKPQALAAGLESLSDLEKKAAWALFLPPPDYFTKASPLFTFQGIIPSLGSYEKQEANLDKLESVDGVSSAEGAAPKEPSPEKKALLAFFTCLQDLDKTLSFINAQRNRYHRG